MRRINHSTVFELLLQVNILQDGSSGDNSIILDQCLHNRTWVLQVGNWDRIKFVLVNK